MKIRLDQLLLDHGLAPDLTKARALIGAGLVLVNDHPADKPGTLFPAGCQIILRGKSCPYVSRGGLKLAAALDYFTVNPSGLICADIGASTGGFTDCLLQHGAARIYAVDVGYGQLAWKLRQDSRVVVMERTNARNLVPGDFPTPLDLAVIDASFISVTRLIPPLLRLFFGKIRILALIKPQFEVSREQVETGGLVRDEQLHHLVIEKLRKTSQTLGLEVCGVTPSPILGAKGNKEYLLLLEG